MASTHSEVEGVGNFQKVSDHVYRGAQPTEEGFKNLAKLGIRTVIDLQQVGDTRAVNEVKWVKAAGMEYISVPMHGMETPSDESVAKVLALLEDSKTGPIFVHCHRGADRTGGIIACYRIQHEGWDNAKALAEARRMGMSWFQVQIQHYVKAYRPKNALAPTEVATTPAPAAPVAAAATLLPVAQ